jgi:hypothetical protein
MNGRIRKSPAAANEPGNRNQTPASIPQHSTERFSLGYRDAFAKLYGQPAQGRFERAEQGESI